MTAIERFSDYNYFNNPQNRSVAFVLSGENTAQIRKALQRVFAHPNYDYKVFVTLTSADDDVIEHLKYIVSNYEGILVGCSAGMSAKDQQKIADVLSSLNFTNDEAEAI